ncbi:MAG: type III pantothenate kinase [Phycisphaerae bacterium]|nr:Type III pantothenate kinase [Phycisphaerales bacterium]
MSQTPADQSLSLVAVSVGNTRTRIGVFDAGQLEGSEAIANTNLEEIAEAISRAAAADASRPVILASVNDPIADQVVRTLGDRVPRERLYRLGSDLPIPMATALDDETTVGQDRLLAALGAFSRAKQACVVIDAGTAITVDFVDGTGVFQGGAIAPGLNMMLRAMSEQTAALPLLRYEKPDPQRGPVGKDTAHAMTLGVRAALVGMTRLLIDTYADMYGAYPQIVATGGDAGVFEDDPLVEHIVPDLILLGIAEACRRSLMEDADEELEREQHDRTSRPSGFDAHVSDKRPPIGDPGGDDDA